MKRFWVIAPIYLCLLASGGRNAVQAQVNEFTEEFVSDPCDPANVDWECKGSTKWVDASRVQCEDGNSHINLDGSDCTLYPGPDEDSYVLLTPATNNQGGSLFREESLFYDSFKLTAVVELRDGSIARPADGMTVTIIGSPATPDPVCAGGGLLATGLGAYPTMIFTFDNWDCNGAGDTNPATGQVSDNHVSFFWGPNGFACGGFPQALGFAVVPYLLNNKKANPAPANRFTFEVISRANPNGTATVLCNMSNADVGMPKTRMFTSVIPDFVPFQGYLGMTAATGDARQNHIIHSVEVKEVPEICLFPPATADRKITNTSRSDGLYVYQKDDVLSVSINLRDIRGQIEVDPLCDVASELTIERRAHLWAEAWAGAMTVERSRVRA